VATIAVLPFLPEKLMLSRNDAPIRNMVPPYILLGNPKEETTLRAWATIILKFTFNKENVRIRVGLIWRTLVKTVMSLRALE
jgi:hypothetical protein